MDSLKDLRSYLIRRFVYTIVLIGIAEYIVIKIVNLFFGPLFARTIYGAAEEVGSLHTDEIILMFCFMLLGLLFQGIERLLPGQLGMLFGEMKDAVERLIQKIPVSARTADNYARLSTYEKVFFLLFMFGVAVVILLPYLAGAGFYSVTVLREFRKIEEAREQANRDYEKKRNLMLSDIAHDLRTPMTTVSGYARALSDGVVSEDKKSDYLDAIVRKSERMDELIGLLFDYVRLGSEGFRLKKEEFDLCEMVRECAAMQFRDIEDAGMELEVDIPEKFLMIKADRLQMSRTVTNLITNAIRHNVKGTTIGVYVMEETNRYRVMVADSGERIDPSQAEHIFEPFVMGEASRSTKGGSGLGLSIAAKVMDMHGYNIRLIQKPNTLKYNIPQEFVKMFMITIKT
ncbi:MAG: HAMP domain-containing histidine kinase [Lachnospiraceae bacterium]|nr:HAMP domain-containing histidine kinase [Lachnospiraceae bacterium]